MSGHGWDYLKHIQGGTLGLGGSSAPAVSRSLGGTAQEDVVARFNADLAEASNRWLSPIADYANEYSSVSGIVGQALDVVGRIGSMRTADDVFRFMDSLASLASAIGPVGAVVGTFLRWVNEAGRVLSSTYPAFTIQLQTQHYAYLDKWIAENVLAIRGGATRPSWEAMFALGWVPIYVLPGPSFCNNSGGRLANWDNGAGRPIEQNADNLKLFSLVAGRRESPIPRCANIRWSEMSSWRTSSEGVASTAEGLDLASVLSGPEGYRTVVLPGHPEARAYVSKGLAFVDNLMYDIGSGSHHYNVWLNVILVNVTYLPDELLIPLTTYVTLMAGKEKATGSSPNMEERAAIRSAAFGPNDEAFKRWNLLRLLYDGGAFRSGPALVTELGARARARSATTYRTRPVETLRPSAGLGPVPVVAGLGVAGLLLWLALS